MAARTEVVTRNGLPALNVKVYDLRDWPNAETIARQYDVPPDVAAQFLEWLWNRAVETFWLDADLLLEQSKLPQGATVYSDGRSGGWLVVEGAGDPDEWTPKARHAWAAFAKDVEGAIDYRSSAAWAHEQLADMVETYREQQADKRVRDAAPKMLEALKGLLANAPKPKGIKGDFSYILYLEAARTAMAEAEGRAP